MFDKIKKLNKNGYIFTKTLKDNNIPTIYLTRLCEKRLIKKVASGVYILPGYIEDDFYINYLKNKDLIYTNNTALYLHSLSPKQFENYQVNFLYGKNVSNVKNLDYKVLRNKTSYELGKEFVLTPMGNLVPCYDKERSICNIFMMDFCDEEVKAFAIKEYKDKYLNINKLYDYAKKLNVYDDVKNVFEVVKLINQEELCFHIPTVEEMSFRQELLADEETMSYNARWGGTIEFPKEKFIETHKRLINDNKDCFYAYVYSNELQCFIGEAGYRYDDELNEYIINILIHAKYRNKGYGTLTLNLLCDSAKSNGIRTIADTIALNNPSYKMFLRAGFREIYRNEEYIFVKKYL